jgi:uncharacterized membrane protein YjgN (DUF898 family)
LPQRSVTRKLKVEARVMTILHRGQQSGRTARRSASVGVAWIALAWLPVSLVLGFAAGEAMLSALGYSSGGSAPAWASAVSDVTALLVCVIPCIVAVVVAWRARRADQPKAIRPLLVGVVLGTALVVITVVSTVGDIVR